MTARTLLLLAVLATPAVADDLPLWDSIPATGLLQDADFFNLVACGAAPGTDCTNPVLRWPRRPLTLAIVAGDPTTEAFGLRLAIAVDHAIAEINASGAGLSISRIHGTKADISVAPTALAEGIAMSDVPGFSGAGIMGVGYTTVWSNDLDQLTKAVILISTSITENDMTSVVLEEVTQSLGPIYDIDDPAYEGVSILSQTSNATTTIAGQDAALLQWLYPPLP